jgi:hypothetical protein
MEVIASSRETSSLQGEDSPVAFDDTTRSSSGVLEYNADSRASTAASTTSSPPRANKKRLPSDFSFLTDKEKATEPEAKSRRLSSSSAASQLSKESGPRLKVCGPETIQTLRGRMFGREVALILCGEAHEDTIDLTRRRGIVDPIYGWMLAPSSNRMGFDQGEALATKEGVTLQGAKKWAEAFLEKEDGKSRDTVGASLVFVSQGRTKGVATVFPPHARRTAEFELPRGSVVYEHADTDEKARDFNKRRLAAPMPMCEQDTLIAERKADRLAEGFELFDDWLIRQAENSIANVEFVLEAPVSAEEVELHIDAAVPPPPLAAERLRCLDLDSDEDCDQEPHLGDGCYLDYLRRRAVSHLPRERFHGIDPRVLGDAEDDSLPESLRGSFQEDRFQQPLPQDPELEELDTLGANWARLDQDREVVSCIPPSFEAWLGGAADLLYHANHIKADYSPFLISCIGCPAALWRFFEALYFGTVPDAIAELCIDEKTRSSACIRSLAYQSAQDAPLMRRPLGKCSDRRKLMRVRALPLDRYLKARGFDTPRTWISGLAEQLRKVGAAHVADAAKAFFRDAVNRMLIDPKEGDSEGDNFIAWLRACHRDVFGDIDTSDPSKLQRKTFVKSISQPTSGQYFLRSIEIPGLDAAFKEMATDPSCPSSATTGAVKKASTVRQRMLSQFIVDAFALRSVDLAIILKIANIVNSAPANAPTVVVLYAGGDHTDSVSKFWQSWGFSHSGLPSKGKISKAKSSPFYETSCLTMPHYLQDFSKLFPVPAAAKDVALRMAQSEEREMRRPKCGKGEKK